MYIIYKCTYKYIHVSHTHKNIFIFTPKLTQIYIFMTMPKISGNGKRLENWKHDNILYNTQG